MYDAQIPENAGEAPPSIDQMDFKMADETKFEVKRNYSSPIFNSQLDTIHFMTEENYVLDG